MSYSTFPMINMKATGENIVALRKQRGLSVADIQAYFGFEAPQAIYKWQKGQSLPSIDNLFALSRLLSVSIDDILIPQKPLVAVLSQDESCDSVFLSGVSFASSKFIRISPARLSGHPESGLPDPAGR